MKMNMISALCYCIVFAAGTAQPLSAQSGEALSTQSMPLDTALGITTVPLWEGLPPGSQGKPLGNVPTLTVFSPQPGRANGTSVVIAPGGAYMGLASNLEGRQIADWFTVRGVTAFVLKYRLGADNLYPVPLEDAQRAIRLVRSNARKYGLSPGRVGMIGFSAGGHLTAMTGTLFDGSKPGSPDPVERLSDRPDFLVLAYPWLNAMQTNSRNLITYCSVIRSIPAEQCKAYERQYTPSVFVTAKTPPTFIYITDDDQVVSVSASMEFYEALHSAGVSSELHIFRHGAHGSGLGAADAALDSWPALLEQWLRDQGLLTADPAAASAP